MTASTPEKYNWDKVKSYLPKVKGILNFIFPFLIIALGVGPVLYYIIGPAEGYMTSDCTDSLRWAYATYESGRLVSKDFIYAAILPFGGNLIFLPYITAFGYSMTSQICGLVTFALLFAAALYYMASGAGFNRYASASLVSAVMLIMSSSAKLREIMWEHIFYYNLGLLFFCFGFGLALRIIFNDRQKKRRRYARPAVFLLFALLAATDGLQTLVCFTLPVLAGIFIERFFDAGEKLSSSRNLKTLGFLAALTAVSAVGFILIEKISDGVTAAYADAYSTYSDMSSWAGNFIGFWENWFSLLGVSVKAGDPLVSLDSIKNMIGIFGGIVLLAAPVVLLCRYNKITDRAVKILLIGHFMVSAFIIFAVTFGRLGGANWRLVPMLGTSVMLTVAASAEMIRQKAASARLGALIAAVLILMASVPAMTIAKMPVNYGRDNSWHVAARELESRGLEYGYANFWWAEAITMFSDGRVQVANLYPNQASPIEYYYQLPADSYKDKKTDNYFLLLTESENAKMAAWLNGKRLSGSITEEFTIVSEPYDLRGYTGTTLYVYVFAENIF